MYPSLTCEKDLKQLLQVIAFFKNIRVLIFCASITILWTWIKTCRCLVFQEEQAFMYRSG